MSGKRKRVVVSLDMKLNAIKRLDQGETIKKVASDLGVGEVTVGDWRRKRAEIEKWFSQRASVCDSEILNRKTMKKGEFEQTSEALFLWFVQMRDKGSPISGPILQAKALEFHKHFNEGEEKFTASIGWLDRWKKRFGVRNLNITGDCKCTYFLSMTCNFYT
jgi:transposase-like protein